MTSLSFWLISFTLGGFPYQSLDMWLYEQDCKNTIIERRSTLPADAKCVERVPEND